MLIQTKMTREFEENHGKPMGLPGWNIDAMWSPQFERKIHDILFRK